MTPLLKVGLILLVQGLVYVLCAYFFEWYVVVLLLSLVGLFYVLNNASKEDYPRLVELALIETFFVSCLYGFFFVGHQALTSYLMLAFILLPQGLLFILASSRGKRYIKALNTALHLCVLIYLSLQSAKANLVYDNYPIIFDPSGNAFYRMFYLIWVVPFLISGQRYHSIGFIVIQSFSLFLSLLHEDFLSMRLFTAQISFVLIFVLNLKVQADDHPNLPTTNRLLSLLSLLGMLLAIAFYVGVL